MNALLQKQDKIRDFLTSREGIYGITAAVALISAYSLTRTSYTGRRKVSVGRRQADPLQEKGSPVPDSFYQTPLFLMQIMLTQCKLSFTYRMISLLSHIRYLSKAQQKSTVPTHAPSLRNMPSCTARCTAPISLER